MPRWHSPPPFQPPLSSAAPESSAPVPSDAAAGAPGPTPRSPMDLSLPEAVRLAFENNNNLRVRRLDPAVAATEIEFERAAFDPVISASAGLRAERERILANSDRNSGGVVRGGVVTGGAGGGSGNQVRGLREYAARSGWNQLLPTGTQYGFDVQWVADDTNRTTPDHFSKIGLSLVQPLLRGFGPEFQLTGIELAVRNTELSRYQFEEAAMDLALAVERAYWDLTLAKLNYAAQLELVDSGRRRLSDNTERVRLGRLGVDDRDLLQDRAALAVREEGLLRIENQVQLARLNLLRLVNPLGRDGFWGTDLQTYVPELEPDRLPVPPDAEAATRTALANRPELRQAQLGVAVNEIEIRRARNALLPQLDVAFDYGPTGHGGRLDSSVRNVGDWRFYDLALSTQFSWAVGNRAAAARTDRAELTRSRSERNIDDVEQAIQLDVRLALQQLDNSAKRLKAALAAQTLNAEKLALTVEAKDKGRRDIDEFIVLQFQDDLTNSRQLVNQAVTDYLRALSQLRRADGTILKLRGLEVRW